MKLFTVSIGNELLRGDIPDTNIATIAKMVRPIGLSISKHTILGDDLQELEECLRILKNEKCLVLVSGGLRPTDDDITREALANVGKRRLIFDQNAYKRIENMFKKFNRNMTPNNKKQAMIPRGATPFYNKNGTAPGFAVKIGKALFCVMPGVPNEMEMMLKSSVIPFLKKGFSLPSPDVVKTFKLVGIGESAAAEKLGDSIKRGADPRIDITVANSIITLKVITLKTLGYQIRIRKISAFITQKLEKYIFAKKDTTLAQALVEKLRRRRLKLSVAESCTGGLLAATLMTIPGASDVFEEGSIVYSNDAKIRTLNVSKNSLIKYGAVSKETALEMANGVLLKTGTDVSCSTTGIAGPSGGSPEKPVGMVCFGFVQKGKSEVYTKRFFGDRNRVRMGAVNFAMKTLIDFI